MLGLQEAGLKVLLRPGPCEPFSAVPLRVCLAKHPGGAWARLVGAPACF